MKRQQYKIGDIAKMKYGKMPPKDILSDEGYPVFSGYRVTGYAKQYLYKEPKLIVVARGVGGTGDVKISPANAWITNLSIVLELEDNIDLKFLLYKLSLEPLKEKLNTGAAQAQITIDNLSNYQISLPSLPIQQKIASILTAYDDLIENNLKRIALLGKTTQLLYEEWFVSLRFPGYEHTKIIDGVPEGWEKAPLANYCESINYGYTASATHEQVGPKFLRITDIVPSLIEWDSVPYCEIPENKRKNFLLKEGDIVVARTGATTGYAKRLHKKFPESVFASYLIRLRLKDEIDDILVGTFIESEDYKRFIKNNASGAAQAGANAKVVSSIEFLLPPTAIQKVFRRNVEPILDKKELLALQNQKLKQARDILLPKLINGEITV